MQVSTIRLLSISGRTIESIRIEPGIPIVIPPEGDTQLRTKGVCQTSCTLDDTMIAHLRAYIQCGIVDRRARGQQDRPRHSVATIDVAQSPAHHLDRLDAEEVAIDRIVEHRHPVDKESGRLSSTACPDAAHIDRRGEARAVVRHVEIRHDASQVG